MNELFFRAYERSTVLSAASVTGSKAAIATEKFDKARDRVSRWKFIVGDLIQTSTDKSITKLSLRYDYYLSN